VGGDVCVWLVFSWGGCSFFGSCPLDGCYLGMLLVLSGRLPWSICIRIGLDKSLVRN
jgi:hypothetical protein